ncbi:hypothetical protein GCM10010531_34710 [Blastococcus jejuensis]|uniref:DUF5615 domain-containing protein n=1 Tax=Blastococcus jejuensis TaxID=351224 RepID=A0ABP6PI77_9ACTN
MRFFCDHNVPESVASRLRKLGHDAWTAAQANLAYVDDDQLTVYAQEQKAVLVTHDREFSQRRRQMVVGKHLWLACNEFDAADLLEERLPEFIDQLERQGDLWVRLRPDGFDVSRQWS